MNEASEAGNICDLVKRHHNYRSRVLNMIASENVASPLVRQFMGSDFENRYGNYEKENPQFRKYQGNEFIREIELRAIEFAKKLFGAKFVELRPVSGTVSDLAVVLGFTPRDGLVMELESRYGGHDTARRLASSEFVRYHTEGFPFDRDNMNIVTEEACRLVEEKRPNLLTLGASVFLFPHPVRELSKSAEEVGATVSYDASHVLGLIAGGFFQDPLREGATIMLGSTHKTFPGPQGGIILASEENEIRERIIRGLHPPLVTNHHPQRMPGLAIALLEMMAFGADYAKQIVANAKSLGRTMHEQGLKVLCPQEDFTESHTLVIDASSYGGGAKIAETLERAGIVTSKISLFENKTPSYVRVGVQEVTRLGMKAAEMQQIGMMFAEALSGEVKLEIIGEKAARMREEFPSIHYAFDEGADPYEFLETSKIR